MWNSSLDKTRLLNWVWKNIKVGDIIKLTTPKGKPVLINFDSVIYCRKTNYKHTSLSFNYAMGKPEKSVHCSFGRLWYNTEFARKVNKKGMNVLILIPFLFYEKQKLLHLLCGVSS